MIFNFKKKLSSVLDFQQEDLCPEIWQNNHLRDDVRDFIYQQTSLFFDRRDIIRYQAFITGCYIASSLGSFNYKEDTDFDIKYVIDVEMFIKHNPEFSTSSAEDITDYLIELGRNSKELTEEVPGTYHAIDAYFYDNNEGVEDNLVKYDSLYSVGSNTWIKEPRKLPHDLPSNYFIEKAKSYAEPYLEKVTKDIEKTKRDSIDFLILKDYLKQLDDVSVKEATYYFTEQLNLIDADLDQLEENRLMIKKLRAENFDKNVLKTELERLGGSLNYGKGNLIFKLFQRYGYMKILNELKDLRESSSFHQEDFPILLSILNN